MKKVIECVVLALFIAMLGITMVVASPFFAVGMFIANPISVKTERE